MHIVNYTEARQNLKKMMQRCWDNSEPVIITNKDGKHVVMVNLDEYESLDETAYLLASPENAKRLRAALNEDDSKSTMFRSMDEFKKKFDIS